MKYIKYFLILFLFACSNKNTDTSKNLEQDTFEKDLIKYENIWNSFLSGDTSVANEENFKKDVIVVTAQGNITGIKDVKDFYMNYLNGFSEIEFTILDAFGQGDRIVKHWNFKGVHTGEFFGIPATNNKLAVLPDETNKECLHPNHLLHSCSNFLTIGPLVKRPAFCINSIIAVLSSAVMQSFINGQNVLCSCVDMSFIF